MLQATKWAGESVPAAHLCDLCPVGQCAHGSSPQENSIHRVNTSDWFCVSADCAPLWYVLRKAMRAKSCCRVFLERQSGRARQGGRSRAPGVAPNSGAARKNARGDTAAFRKTPRTRERRHKPTSADLYCGSLLLPWQFHRGRPPSLELQRGRRASQWRLQSPWARRALVNRLGTALGPPRRRFRT